MFTDWSPGRQSDWPTERQLINRKTNPPINCGTNQTTGDLTARLTSRDLITWIKLKSRETVWPLTMWRTEQVISCPINQLSACKTEWMNDTLTCELSYCWNSRRICRFFLKWQIISFSGRERLLQYRSAWPWFITPLKKPISFRNSYKAEKLNCLCPVKWL